MSNIKKVNAFLKYFNYIEFIKGKKSAYLIIVNIIIGIILFLFAFLIGIAFGLKERNFYQTIFFDILAFIIPLFSISFFGQILTALLSASKCTNNFTYYDLNQKCNEGLVFFLEEILSIISIIFLFIISLFVVSIYYIPVLSKDNVYLKKISSIPPQIFFVTKIVIIFLFYLENYLNERNRKINDWLMLVILNIISGINANFSFFYNNIEHKILQLIDNIMSFLLFWGFFSLLIGMIFKNIDYYGTDYLIMIGTIIIIFYFIYYSKKYKSEYWQNINYIYTNQGRLIYIINCLNIIEKRNYSRKNKIILKSILEKVELYCIDPHCKIKQYFHHLKKGIDSSILLYGHCQTIFKISISKNKNDITAKIYYIIFVITKLNKRKKAKILLEKLEDRQLILFQDLFNIYRVRKLIEETSIISDYNDEKLYYANTINFIQYKKYIKNFKSMLYKISSLYLNFWTLLLNIHNQLENIEKLNNTGKEIKDLINPVEEYYNKIYNYKNDESINKLYISFLKNVLVDKKLYEKYNKNVANVSLEFKKFNKEEDFSNYDINKLKENDNTQWILISAKENNYGKILNLSLGICPIIGYKKREIIGSNINILLPNIFHKPHDHMLHKLFYDSKYKFYENLSKRVEYKPEYITKVVYCKNKSKFLVPFPFRAFFIKTEEGEHIFEMNIIKHKCFPHTKNDKNEEPWCCVLTDKHFIIQTFTPNAFEFLGLNSGDIDSGLNITTCIAQFANNEFFNNITDKDINLDNEAFNYSSEVNFENTSKSFYNANTIKSEIKLKRDLTKKEFFSPQIINWKYFHNNNKNKFNDIKVFSKVSSGKYEIKINNISSIKDKKLFLIIRESKINNNIIGYKFLFKKFSREHNTFSYNNNENELEKTEFIDSEFSDLSNLNSNIVNSPTGKTSVHKNSIKGYDSSLNLLTNEKPADKIKRRNSQGNFIQKININNFVYFFKIDSSFVPKNKCNFIFDIKKRSYIYHNKIKKSHLNENGDNLVATLLLEAKEKLSFLRKTTQKENEKIKGRSKNIELISNSQSNDSSYSGSIFNSITDSSNGGPSNVDDKGNSTRKDIQKRYNSFGTEKKRRKSQDSIRSASPKNKTSKQLFDKKSLPNQILYEKVSSQLKEKSKMNLDFKYYEVNLKHIRFLKYDFDKEMIIDQPHFEKLCKMDEILNDLKNNKSHHSNEDDNYPYINIDHFIAMKKKLVNKLQYSPERKVKLEPEKNLNINKILFNKNKEQIEKKIENEKKIDEALNQKDKQNSIKNFVLISIICLLIIYSAIGVNLYIYLDEVSKDKKNIELICDSTDLKFFFNSAVYFIRELTLLNIKNITEIPNGEYIGYPSNNKNDYINKLLNTILEIYSYIHTLNELIMSTDLPLSENATYYLNDKEYIIEALRDDFNIFKVRTGLSNGIIMLDGYLYNLVELNSTIDQSHEDVYPFIHNTLNKGWELLNIQIELYINELKLRGKKNKILALLSVLIIFIILLCIFFAISKAYSSVLKNKANYFYIFYSIKLDAIQSLINNCEYFIQKLKEEQKLLSNEIMEDLSFGNVEKSSSFNPKINPIFRSVIMDINDNNYNMLSPNKRKGVLDKLISNQRDKNAKKESVNYRFSIKIFNIGFILFCLIIIAYLCIVVNNYISFVNLISEYALYNYHIQNFQNNIIEVMNAYREYLLDQNTYINYIISDNYINNKMNYIFETKFNDNIIFNKYRNKIPGYLEKYDFFHDQALCSRRNDDYFKTEEECKDHMQGITLYGINVVYTSVVEEIRIYKNMVNQLLINDSVIGNLTLYGSKHWNEKNIIDEYNSKINNSLNFYRLFLFNNNSFHKDLNILFINAIYPYINTEREMTGNAINEAIKNKGKTYIIYFVSLYIGISLLFVIVWIPMIKNMNLTIYKTKKMLSIIPLHILASQTNINTLLNLENENKYKSTNENI